MSKKNQLRIIGGQWRGRKLPILEIDGLRPTGDRIRETLFNWIMHDIAGSQCLDLFSGTGVLGLECLSRGAKAVTMIERNQKAAQKIQQHCTLLNTTSATVINDDCLSWLTSKPLPQQTVDIAFVDPPFNAKLWDQAIDCLLSSNLLRHKSLVYIETPRKCSLKTPASLEQLKEKSTGDISYRLFQLN